MHEKVGFKQVLERYGGVLGFSKTKFYFEQKKIDQELTNRHTELPIGYSCRIIWTKDAGLRKSSYIWDVQHAA
jgi:hypothetical protein